MQHHTYIVHAYILVCKYSFFQTALNMMTKVILNVHFRFFFYIEKAKGKQISQNTTFLALHFSLHFIIFFVVVCWEISHWEQYFSSKATFICPYIFYLVVSHNLWPPVRTADACISIESNLFDQMKCCTFQSIFCIQILFLSIGIFTFSSNRLNSFY